jgi:hypothetical protein
MLTFPLLLPVMVEHSTAEDSGQGDLPSLGVGPWMALRQWQKVL